MYEVRGEKPKGPFGILRQRTAIGQLDEKAEIDELGLANGIHLSSDEGTLVIKSTSASLFRVDLRAQPQMRLPKAVTILSPDRPEMRTGRSHITITSLEEGNTERIIIQSPEPEPLVLNPGELRAMMMGINAMRTNVRAAYENGRKNGLDEGYIQGSQPHPTNL